MDDFFLFLQSFVVGVFLLSLLLHFGAFYPFSEIICFRKGNALVNKHAISSGLSSDCRKSLRVCISSAFQFTSCTVSVMQINKKNEREKNTQTENNSNERDEKKECENSLNAVAL